MNAAEQKVSPSTQTRRFITSVLGRRLVFNHRLFQMGFVMVRVNGGSFAQISPANSFPYISFCDVDKLYKMRPLEAAVT
jgi:hypothetical protein